MIHPKPNTCTHEHAEPVDIRDHTGAVTTVGHICSRCLTQLPAAWGCIDCQWTETRRLCDPVPELTLTTPCPRHQENP